jgi:hypothetical protein
MVARELRVPLPQPVSLKAMISRWENDHLVPDEFNRRVLCLALGIPISDLGLPEDPDPWPVSKTQPQPTGIE